MINSFILVTMFWSQQPVKINIADIQNLADLKLDKPACAVLVMWVENDMQIAGTCDEVRAKIKAATK